MPRPPKRPKWFSASNEERFYKKVMFTLSEAALEKLDRISGGRGRRSMTVEKLIEDAPEPDD